MISSITTLAQDAVQQDAVQQVAGTPGKSYTMDIVIVVVVVGIALFAICQSSSRN